ncbi:unnamed protein product [Fraxinus pennsylvanica]|uniref:Uncharacterized protein n=1 Tax=Fraxinus pennsylvanica TaxID=56036 RepID=A0AAD2ECH6_9LAMI|nr:unnamed protein product [Fraxinus pennsylvanica]
MWRHIFLIITTRASASLVRIHSYGLGHCRGEKWAKHRKIVTPAFHLHKLKNTLFYFIPGWRYFPTKANRRLKAISKEIQSLLKEEPTSEGLNHLKIATMILQEVLRSSRSLVKIPFSVLSRDGDIYQPKQTEE